MTETKVPWGQTIPLSTLDKEVVLDAVMYSLAEVKEDNLVYTTEEKYNKRVKKKFNV